MPDHQDDEASSLAENPSQLQTCSPRKLDVNAKSVTYSRSHSTLMAKRSSEAWLTQSRTALAEKFDHPSAETKSELLLSFDAMINGVSKPIDQAQSIRKVAEFVKNDGALRKVIRESGALALVIHIMALFCSGDADMQVAGCELLVLVSEDNNEAQQAMVALEAVEAVLDGMGAHPSSAEVQTWGPRALRALAWGYCNRQTMIRHGAISDLIAAMRNHPSVAGVQEHVASTIAQIVYGSSESKLLVGTTGGIQLILSAMRIHPRNMNLQGQCCFALRNLSWESPENHVLMHEYGADALLISALESFPRVPGVQDQALAALGNLMFHDEQTFRITIEGRDSITLHNALFSALRTFPHSSSITSNAFSLLINMCELSKTDRIRHLRRIATTPDIVRLLCKPIQDQSTRTIESVTQVSALIISLSVVGEFQNSLRGAKVIELLLSCIKQFVQKDPSQCGIILDALHSALSGNDESKKLFNQIGGVAALSEMMTEAYSTELLEEKACIVLDNVSNGQFEATAEKMSNRKEAMKSVLTSMINFPANNKLQESGCSVMIKVAATSAQDAAQLIDMGAGPVVEKARLAHKGNPAVESLANQLLTLLVPSDGTRNTRGQALRGNAGVRLRSRSRTVEKGARSRSSMGRSKSPVKKRGMLLESVDENANTFEESAEVSAESSEPTSNLSAQSRNDGPFSGARTTAQPESVKRETGKKEMSSTLGAPDQREGILVDDHKMPLVSRKLQEDKNDRNFTSSNSDRGKGPVRPSQSTEIDHLDDQRETTRRGEKRHDGIDSNCGDRKGNTRGIPEAGRAAKPLLTEETEISSPERDKSRRRSPGNESRGIQRESHRENIHQSGNPDEESGSASNNKRNVTDRQTENRDQSRRETETSSSNQAVKDRGGAVEDERRNRQPPADRKGSRTDAQPSSVASNATNSGRGELRNDGALSVTKTVPSPQPLPNEKDNLSTTAAEGGQGNELKGLAQVGGKPIEKLSPAQEDRPDAKPSDPASGAPGSAEFASPRRKRTGGRRGREDEFEFEGV
jgi:hypothetical protein